MQTVHPPADRWSSTTNDSRLQTPASVDWQWRHVLRSDFMPGDPWFDAHAADIYARELCGIDPGWFAGRRVLHAGRELLVAMWQVVRPAGLLVIERSPESRGTRRRTVDRPRDRRRPVPAKVAAMLRRRRDLTTGEALHAVGDQALLNPLSGDEAASLLHQHGAAQVERVPSGRGTELLLARRP